MNTSHYVVIDSHTDLVVSTKFARRARAAAVAASKNKADKFAHLGRSARYTVAYVKTQSL
jgi:hypothetical protein